MGNIVLNGIMHGSKPRKSQGENKEQSMATITTTQPGHRRTTKQLINYRTGAGVP